MSPRFRQHYELVVVALCENQRKLPAILPSLVSVHGLQDRALNFKDDVVGVLLAWPRERE